MEQRNRVSNFDDGVGVGAGDAAEENTVDGGCLVLKGMQDELDVRGLSDLVSKLAAHRSLSLSSFTGFCGAPARGSIHTVREREAVFGLFFYARRVQC